MRVNQCLTNVEHFGVRARKATSNERVFDRCVFKTHAHTNAHTHKRQITRKRPLWPGCQSAPEPGGRVRIVRIVEFAVKVIGNWWGDTECGWSGRC